MARFQLLWPKDADGYRIVEETPGPPRPPSLAWPFPSGRTLLDDAGPTTWIVANQGKPFFEDRFKIQGLWRRLAELGTARNRRPRPANAKGALDFVENYGFLRERDHGGRESVEFIAHNIRVARALVRVIDRKDWSRLDRWALDNASAIRLHPKFHFIEDDDRSELFYGPNTLIDAIWLQALQDVANGTELIKCDRPGCPEWFAAGPGTGRQKIHERVDRPPVRYHSPSCQKAHAYMKKKGVSK